MRILLSDGSIVDSVTHCYPESISGMLVVEINTSSVNNAMKSISLFQDAELDEITVRADGRDPEVFRGYKSMMGMSYNVDESKVIIFLTK